MEKDPNIGKKFNDRYELTEKIGTGGMAIVYKAIDMAENKTVAVKILKPEFASQEDFCRRFRNECKATAVLSHPNIVKILDVGLNDVSPQYMVMEYIDGVTLKFFMEQQKVLRWQDSLQFTLQILNALKHAHSRGIVHRDIKPHNIMIYESGQVKVMDFGIAQFSHTDGCTYSDKTLGSVHYMSPEHLEGKTVDERSDIYSVGVMLYEMLTGRKPFDDDDLNKIANKHLKENPIPPKTLNNNIPKALEEIVLHALEKEPDDRYQSASQMIDDINAFKLDNSIVFGYKNPIITKNKQDIFKDEDYDDDDFERNNYDQFDISDNNYDDEDDYDDEEDDEEEEKRSYVIPILLAVTVAVVLVSGLIIFWSVYNSFNEQGGIHKGTVVLTNFVGQDIIKVQQDFRDKLKFDIKNEYNDQYEEGIIFWQGQAAGKTVKEGFTVSLKVSKGKKMGKIPDMTGKTSAVAESELKAAGFVPVIRSVWDEKVPKGQVISTEPGAGKEYPLNGSVTIFVSRGPVETRVKVPDLVGLTKEKAIAALKENKLEPVVEDIEHEGDKGKVVEQDIEKDTLVDRNSKVTIYVSTGEVSPRELTFELPLPGGLHGGYSVEIYKDGNVDHTQTISNAETIGGSINITVKGKKTQTFTIKIRNDESGKSVIYARYKVDFEKNKAELQGNLDENGLLGITPEVTTTPRPTEAPTTQAPSESSNSQNDTKAPDVPQVGIGD